MEEIYAYRDGLEELLKQANEVIGEYEDGEFKRKEELVEDMIEMAYETKTLVRMVGEQYRGFGKTKALANKSNEIEANLIVPFECNVEHLEEYGFHNVISEAKAVEYIELASMGLMKNLDKCKFMVDEGVNSKTIDSLIAVGFVFCGGISR